jgi:hypothetical protein
MDEGCHNDRDGRAKRSEYTGGPTKWFMNPLPERQKQTREKGYGKLVRFANRLALFLRVPFGLKLIK